MIKKVISGVVICLLAVSLAGCGNSDDGENANNFSNNSNHSSGNNNNGNNSNGNNNNGNNYNGNNGNGNNRGGTSSNGAGGFTLDDALRVLENGGIISGKPEKADVSNMEEVLEGYIYNGKYLIVRFNLTPDDESMNKISEIFKRGTVNYQGKDYPFDGWGGLAIVFLDGKIDNNAIQILRTL